MLLTSEPSSGQSSRAPSILESPTLARVERARLRFEANTGSTHQHYKSSFGNNFVSTKNFLAGRSAMNGAIKRGLLWQQRDRLFSRWKERYFILTRDYLHCFKRASGAALDRISDMGQFMFKIKLIDVDKVEWLNRRSYSVIGLHLGREGRILLRYEQGLEDWFELLEECTLISKERRRILKMVQGSRSRASLAAPPTHAFLQANYFCLGGTYSSALDDWSMNRQQCTTSIDPLLLSDSVPDLNSFNNDINHSSLKKYPHSSSSNLSRRCSNDSYINTRYISSRQTQINYSETNNGVSEEIETDVQLRHPKGTSNGNGNDNKEEYWMYLKPSGPADNSPSVASDLNYSTCDSELNTSFAQHSISYRATKLPQRDAENIVDSSKIDLLMALNFHKKHLPQATNMIEKSRYSIQAGTLNENDYRTLMTSINTSCNEPHDPNRNLFHNIEENVPDRKNSVVYRERYQYPALVSVIGEARTRKFRDRSFSDCQQYTKHTINHNTSPVSRSVAFFSTPNPV